MHGLEWMRFLVVNVMFMMRNTMMEDIKKYYFQDRWFKEPYTNLQKDIKFMKRLKNICLMP
jgi:hypothetical protein